MKKPTLRRWAPAFCVAAVTLATVPAEARPYASGITNNAGVVSFLLNEAADDVKVVFNGGTSTNVLGSLPKGAHTFNLGGNTSFEIRVTKNGGEGYMHVAANGTNAVAQMISDSTNTLLRFWNPRTIAVNTNAASPHFGKFYVSNNSLGTPGGTTREMNYGLFMLNADQSSAHEPGSQDTPYNPGFIIVGGSSSPYQLHVGPDDNLYVADWTDGFGNVYTATPDLTTGGPVLKILTQNAVPPIGTDNTHGSITAVHVEGSTANGNLTVYTVDEDMQTDKTAPAPLTEVNSVWRYDIGSSAFPYEGNATKVFTPGLIPNTGIRSTAIHTGLHRATNGYFYYVHNRANDDTSGLVILDANGNHIWNSRTTSTNQFGGITDVLKYCAYAAVSPDMKWIAVSRAQNTVWIMPLTNGIPDLSKRLLLNAFGSHVVSSTIRIRGVAFDAAQNLYVVDSFNEAVRIYAPGGTATAVTTSDGTFRIETPATSVSIVASTPTTTEGGTPAVFTLTRNGDTSSALTVGLNVGGTAANGSDYVTIATNVTFNAGASSTTINITPINDSIAEFTETVIVSLSSSPQYTVGTSSATVSILDNEPVEISVAATQPRLLEAYAFSTARLQLSRRGLLTSAVTVNLSYSGATLGSHFNAPATVNLAAGAVNANVTLTSVNNNVYEGNKEIVCTVAAGTGYSAGSPGSASVTLFDDEYPAGQLLFADNFQTASAANWTIGNNGSDNTAEFEYDYSTNGIPVAPATTDGSRKGLRLRANVSSYTAQAAINAFPLQTFSGNYRVKFDMWLNFNGPMIDGGPGSTMAFIAGVGASAPNAQVPTVSGEGVMIKAIIEAQDGDAAGDYSAYLNGVLLSDNTGFYPAGTTAGARNNTNPYYSIWGGIPAPAEHLALYPGQTGNTSVGCIGMSWHTVVLTKSNEVVTWTVDGITMASVTNATPVADGNAFVGFYDPYASAAPELCFAIVDNFRVETLASAPSVLGISRNGNNLTLTWTGSATLQEASALTGSPSDWSDIQNAVTGHTVNTSTGSKFYRLRQ